MTSEYRKKYYQEHRDKLLKESKDYYNKNKESIKKKHRKDYKGQSDRYRNYYQEIKLENEKKLLEKYVISKKYINDDEILEKFFGTIIKRILTKDEAINILKLIRNQ